MNTVGMGGRVYGVEQINTKTGASMVKCRLQASRYKKDAFYVEVIAFDKNADFMIKHVKEGSGVFISGKLDEDTWDGKDGAKMRKLKIVADRVEFLPSTQKKDGAVKADGAEGTEGTDAPEDASMESDPAGDF